MTPVGRRRRARAVGRAVTHHLFVLSPNNSGSTFVSQALGRCRDAWSLPGEGQDIPGFAGEVPHRQGRALVWAAFPEWIEQYRASPRFDWEANRLRWYSRARAQHRDASVFVEKSPPFLLLPGDLRTHFVGARFVVMVRHPLAVAEGIIRNRRTPVPTGPDGATPDVRIAAADHVLHCLRIQSENARELGPDAVVTTYERICADPAGFDRSVRALLPALADVGVDVELSVKGRYDERLRDMNADQIGRIDPADRQVLEERFAPHAALLAEWGYSL